MARIAIVEYLAGARYDMLAFTVAVVDGITPCHVLGHHHSGAVADNAIILIYSHSFRAIHGTDARPSWLVLYSFH